MATITIPWNDGSGDNITLTYDSMSGNQAITVYSDEYTGTVADRTKTITFTTDVGNVTKTLTIVQEKVAEQYIVFEDAAMGQICATKWGDGVGIYPSQAAAVKSIPQNFVYNNTTITSFKELVYFTGVTSIGSQAFRGCTSLMTIGIPPNYTSRGSASNMFVSAPIDKMYLVNLENFLLIDWSAAANSPGYSSSGIHLYLNDVEITTVVIPSTVTAIKAYAFYRCKYLTEITLHSSITSVGSNAFNGCTGLVNLTIPSSVTSVSATVVAGSGSGTGALTIGGNYSVNTGLSQLSYTDIYVNGNFSCGSSGNYCGVDIGKSLTLKTLRIGGNLTISASQSNRALLLRSSGSSKQSFAFLEIGGTITLSAGSGYLIGSNDALSTGGAIVHFAYNGLVCSTVPSGLTLSRVTAIYVGDGSSAASDNAVLALYTSSSAWSSLSGKLATWYSYNGDYKE